MALIERLWFASRRSAAYLTARIGEVARGHRNRTASLYVLVAVVCVISGAVHAAAELPKPISIETLFEHPQHGRAELSPNTEKLATTARVGDRMHLVVIDLETRKAQSIAGFGDADVAWFTWINDRRLVFNIEDRTAGLGEQPGQGLFAVDADGTEFRELMPTLQKQSKSAVRVFRSAEYLQRCRGTDDILMVKAVSDNRGYYVVRKNTRNGRETTMVLGISGDIVDAYADSAGELRGVVSIDREGHALVWYRSGADATWQQVAKFSSMFSSDAWSPVGFSADGKTMWVSGHRDRDYAAVYAFDLERKQLGDIAISHPGADVKGGLHFDADSGALIGVTVQANRPVADWFDPDWARAQASIDAALPAHVNELSGKAKSRLLVFSYSDRDPGRYYLYDVQKRRLSEELSIRPDIVPAQMAEMRLIEYEARDKLRIPAYLTLPPSSAAKKLPLVMLVHGGPFLVRDTWQFDPEVQFLASRGYAVLQPQFRGSGGFGNRHFRAGWKAWGLAMQDDLTDGVRTLVAQGTVDPNRVCIMGASYGGYAALMGLAKDPDLYRCGIDFAGVSDIRLMFSIGWSDTANSLWAEFDMKELIGDPDKMESQFVATSPVEQAKRIKAPVLLAYGSDDYRVPITHGEKMRDALEAAGKQFEWHTFSGEGHGLMRSQDRVSFYREVESFLVRYLAVPAADGVASAH